MKNKINKLKHRKYYMTLSKTDIKKNNIMYIINYEIYKKKLNYLSNVYIKSYHP